MALIFLDFETYSDVDLKKVGAWIYSRHPSTKVLCVAFTEDSQNYKNGSDIYINVFKSGYIPYVLSCSDGYRMGYCEENFKKWILENGFSAWNAFFEYCILKNVLNIDVPLDKIIDAAAYASYFGLPRSLGDCGKALGLPQEHQKDNIGKILIKFLSKPLKNRIRLSASEISTVREKHPEFDGSIPALGEYLLEYCKQDITTMKHIWNSLPVDRIPASEKRIQRLDLEMNIRGVPMDVDLAKKAIYIDKELTAKVNKEVYEITDGEVNKITQTKTLVNWMNVKLVGNWDDLCDETKASCAPISSLIKKDLNESIEKLNKRKTWITEDIENIVGKGKCHLPEYDKVIRLLNLRLSSNKSSTKKYESVMKITDTDGRARGLLKYYGCHTGRWSGSMFQPQNLPRKSKLFNEHWPRMIKEDDLDAILLFSENGFDLLSSCIRSVITAETGKAITACDFSSIEARVLAYYSGQGDIIEAFRKHEDIYKHAAASMMNKRYGEITPEERQIGKVATLLLGYQGGEKALLRGAGAFGIALTVEKAIDIKDKWRAANRHIVQYWRDVERAVKEALIWGHNNESRLKGLNFSYSQAYKMLDIELPSGRSIYYYDPKIEKSESGQNQITYLRKNQVTQKIERHSTYGGKLVENIVQGIARDILAESLLSLSKHKELELLTTVHDEIILMHPVDINGLQVAIAAMKNISWCKDLPLEAEGYTALRYTK